MRNEKIDHLIIIMDDKQNDHPSNIESSTIRFFNSFLGEAYIFQAL